MRSRPAFLNIAIPRLFATGLIASVLFNGCSSGRQTLLPGGLKQQASASMKRALQSDFPRDKIGRLLIWIPVLKEYRAALDGFVLSLDKKAPSAADIAALKAALDKLKHQRKTTSIVLQTQPEPVDFQTYCTSVGPGCETACSPVTGNCVSIAYIYDVTPEGDLMLGEDNQYHDVQGRTWVYCSDCTDQYGDDVPWLQQIAQVSCSSCPQHALDPAMEPYVTAYNGINGMNTGLGYVDWLVVAFLLYQGGVQINALPPIGTLIASGGVSAALTAEINQLEELFAQLEGELGAGNVTLVTADAANAEAAAAGYSQAPFLVGTAAAEITTTAAASGGTMAGSQLVQFAESLDTIGRSSWFTTMSEVVDSNGNMMSAAEIADKLSLPFMPAFYAQVTNIQLGTNIIVGKASGLFGETGGGTQYWVTGGIAGGSVNFASAIAIGSHGW